MRASTLFAVAVAVLLGLAATITARSLGLFTVQKPSPPPAPAREEISVLVPTHNLFQGFVVQTEDVKSRPLRPEEVPHYKEHKDEYLPPVPQAAVMRVVKKTTEAEQPLLKEHLQDLSMAEPLNQRLLPSMRALNLDVPKEHCAGGLIQVGDWVDVHLTSNIEGDGKAGTHTANLARRLRIVAKRNILWPVLSPLPDDQPVHYTVEANPYRAALIEFARTKGVVDLVPVAAAEQQELEAHRQAVLKAGNHTLTMSFSDPETSEYRDEDARVEAFSHGDLTVGEGDLIRIFGLKTTAPPTAPVTVQMYSGVEHESNVYFNGGTVQVVSVKAGRTGTTSRPAAGEASPGFEFHNPEEGLPKKCKT